jgi:hypothetical protein
MERCGDAEAGARSISNDTRSADDTDVAEDDVCDLVEKSPIRHGREWRHGNLFGAAAAQTSARFGTWKLKGAESNARGPKALTRTDEPTEDGGVKVTYEGIEADGSRIAYSYTAKYDGNKYRPTGVGMGNGWETISLKLLDDHSWEAILKRGGRSYRG